MDTLSDLDYWAHAVRRVGDDDRTMPEDVVAWLFARDRIQVAYVNAPTETQAELDVVLAPLDAEYRTRTRIQGDGMTGFVSHHGEGWWWHRVPKRMGRSFPARLRE